MTKTYKNVNAGGIAYSVQPAAQRNVNAGRVVSHQSGIAYSVQPAAQRLERHYPEWVVIAEVQPRRVVSHHKRCDLAEKYARKLARS